MSRFVAIMRVIARSARTQAGVRKATVTALEQGAEIEKRHGTTQALLGMLDAWMTTVGTVYANTGNREVLTDAIARLERARAMLDTVLTGGTPAGSILTTATVQRGDDIAEDPIGNTAGSA
ncbi:hypothetical protein HL658_09895 [Azospirillum sp. RWY-5-1]|uniref:Uncharacterized protein n=1 Tax=Azospirillum oleiclasticum TaxID=2735135 RepID=A0ABX2T6R3_9PROT|nr:hypothetical protein [Azospirillum oleiclasticum]NYZ12864.1 hypothetical protein [Azospirillum oleiclasticum]NYZ20024.1 hypothetical protein [Azospirillum oleiclasticum]